MTVITSITTFSIDGAASPFVLPVKTKLHHDWNISTVTVDVIFPLQAYFFRLFLISKCFAFDQIFCPTFNSVKSLTYRLKRRVIKLMRYIPRVAGMLCNRCFCLWPQRFTGVNLKIMLFSETHLSVPGAQVTGVYRCSCFLVTGEEMVTHT